jgi:hypothetical protein
MGVSMPSEEWRRRGVEDDGAVDLAFAGGALGDVGDPQLVMEWAGELAVHQVTPGRVWCLGPGPAVTGQALDPARFISISTALCRTVMPRPRANSACTRRDP